MLGLVLLIVMEKFRGILFFVSVPVFILTIMLIGANLDSLRIRKGHRKLPQFLGAMTVVILVALIFLLLPFLHMPL